MDLVSRLPAGANVLVIFNGFSGHLDDDAEFRRHACELLKRTDLKVTLVASAAWAFSHIAQKLGVPVPWKKVTRPNVESYPSRILFWFDTHYDGLSFCNPTVLLTGSEVRRIIEFYPPLQDVAA